MNQAENKRMPDFCNRRQPFHYVTALNVLMKMGVDIDRINILAVGEYRNYRGEIQSQQPQAGTSVGEGTEITLKVGFSSAVDSMPYQFFYGITGITARSGAWEDSARAMMAPYDASVIRFDSRAKYQTLKFSLGMADLEHLLQYLKLFDFHPWKDTTSIDEALLWASMLPSFHEWAGNPELVSEVFKNLFGYRFRIVENVESEFAIPEDLRSQLRNRSSHLGKDLVLGHAFREYNSSYELHVSGVRPEELDSLLPGKPMRRKLEWALGICMPNNLVCKIMIHVEREGLVLGRTKQQSCLGYSTHLS